MKSQARYDLLLTTGECAEQLQVSESKVRRYIDDRLLSGITLPGSTHRRVRGTVLRKFMIDYGFMKDPKPITEEKTQKGP